ncbi:MAG TPA: cupin domain-containing protein [Trebonia sp.]
MERDGHDYGKVIAAVAVSVDGFIAGTGDNPAQPLGLGGERLFTWQFGIITSEITSESPAGDIIPTHSHEDTHETFYVLEGKVRVFVEYPDGRQVTRLLEPGDFGYVPARLTHAYRVEQAARMLGVLSGGFERFLQHMGTATDTAAPDQPPFIPDLDRIQAAGRQHGTRFFPGYTWPNA